MFKAHEICPAPKFQEAIGEMRRKRNTRDRSITKEDLIDEASSMHDTIVLEKNWITQD